MTDWSARGIGALDERIAVVTGAKSAGRAQKRAIAERLWTLSEQLTGVHYPDRDSSCGKTRCLSDSGVRSEHGGTVSRNIRDFEAQTNDNRGST